MSLLLIDNLQELQEHQDEISEFICSDSTQSNMFSLPELIELYINHHPNIRIYLFLYTENSKISLFIPFYIEKEEYGLKLSIKTIYKLQVKTLKLFGNSISYNRNVNRNNIINYIAEAIDKIKDKYDFIRINDVITDSIESEISSHLQNINSDYVEWKDKEEARRFIKLDNDIDTYLGSMKRKVRYNLKRNIKLFETGHGKPLLRKTVNRDEVSSFLNHTEEIYKKTWQANSLGYEQKNTDYNHRKMSLISELGNLRSYVLFKDKTPVAFVIGYQFKNNYIYQDIGYDPAYKKWSPGSVLLFLLIEELFSIDKPELLDFGFGENDYKKIYGNTEKISSNIYIYKKYTKGHAVISAQKFLMNIYRLIHKLLTWLKIDSFIRKLIKR